MRVLLADDQPEVRSALRLLLEQDPSLTVVGEAAEADDLLAQVGADCPDLLLLDWELPGGTVAELVTELRAQCPELVIIALSSRPEARRADLKVGADGFISKGSPPQEVIAAVKNCQRPNEV